ncbi:MAG: hypothetical protein C4519_26280 [Desulfobacteraceae bacterium]|nr:MAG: hypothetical protein C4519_26280 [Desulfobacteraceae bacterium]
MPQPAIWQEDLQTDLNQRGSSLIGLIVAILLISIIGAALLSQTTTATFHTVSANSGNRAFYLAESGYRYAAAKMAAGADLNVLHGRTYSLSAGEQFTLSFQPHIFRVTNVQPQWLTTEVPYGVAPAFASQRGRLRINNGPSLAYRDIENQAGNRVRFRREGGNWNGLAAIGDSVSLVVLSDGTAVAQGGDLHLQAATPAAVFPEHNGRFQLNGVLYRYVTRENTRLRGIARVDGAWAPLAPANGDEVVLQPFVKVASTGIFGQGTLGTNRLITYHVPIGTGGATASEWHERFDDPSLGNWNAPSSEGAHAVAAVDGGNALRVTGTDRLPATQLDSSQLALNWSQAGVDLASAWSGNGNLLNYDVQAKIFLNDEPVYLAGLSVRLDGNGNHYGISLLKAASNNADGIPDNIVPIPDQPMIVLWERAHADYRNWRWLAYKTLVPSDFSQGGIIYFEDDMEAGTTKWTTDAPWGLVANSPPANNPPSPTRCWHDSPGGDSPEDADISIESVSFDLSTAIAPQLSFYHRFDLYRFWFLGWYEDYADVEISTNNGGGSGAWTRLARYTGTQALWTPVTIDLTDYAGRRNVRIRFRLRTRDWLLSGNSPGDGWYVDDVQVYDRQVSWPTLLVRIREQNAAGGAFAGQRVNDIQVFFGDNAPSGTPDGDPRDNRRLANARDQVNWPPDDVNDTDAGSDYFTLVRWDAANPGVTSIELRGAGVESNTILRSNNPVLTTPASGVFAASRPEIGLHTWGWGSVGGVPNNTRTPDIFFDDFAIRLPGRPGAFGFLPALQE